MARSNFDGSKSRPNYNNKYQHISVEKTGAASPVRTIYSKENTNMTTRTFQTDLDLGKAAEREMFKILAARDNVIAIKFTDWTKVGYDISYMLEGNIVRNMEVKSLAGGYPTGVVEVWTDNAKTRRPHWADADIIAFKDRSQNKFFVYDAKEVIRYLETIPDNNLTRANNGCKDDSGWIVKFKWENGMPGFLGTVKGL